MNKFPITATCAVLLTALCGCRPPRAEPVDGRRELRPLPDGAATGEPGWIDLFNGRDLSPFKAAQGRVVVRDGAIVLAGEGGRAAAFVWGLKLRDGVLEVLTRRPPTPGNDGAVSFGLRIPYSLFWTSRYVYGFPRKVQTMQGSWKRPYPPAERTFEVSQHRGPIRWRFELDGETITVYRAGEKVATLSDPDPKTGTIGLSAADATIRVLQVRYRPASGEASD